MMLLDIAWEEEWREVSKYSQIAFWLQKFRSIHLKLLRVLFAAEIHGHLDILSLERDFIVQKNKLLLRTPHSKH